VAKTLNRGFLDALTKSAVAAEVIVVELPEVGVEVRFQVLTHGLAVRLGTIATDPTTRKQRDFDDIAWDTLRSVIKASVVDEDNEPVFTSMAAVSGFLAQLGDEDLAVMVATAGTIFERSGLAAMAARAGEQVSDAGKAPSNPIPGS
jgi:hypothetical protein